MAEHPYGFVQDGKVYRKAYGEHPDLEIGEVKDTEEAALAYYEQRFEQLKEKVALLEEDVYSKSNKGSYLMKLLHLKETLSQYEGLGDFEAVYQRLEQLENYIREIINQNRERNLEIKTALLAEAAQLKEVTNWKDGTELAKDLKMRWIRTGSLDDEHQEQFEEQFDGIIQDFFDRRSAFYEDRKQMMEERLKQYQELVERAKVIVKNPDTRQANYDLRSLQREWKELGKIPALYFRPLQEEMQRITRPIMQQHRPQRRPMQQNGGYQPRTSYQQRPNNRYNAPVPEKLEERKALLERMRAIDSNDRNAVDQVEAIQNEYKALGFARSAEISAISEELFNTGSLIRERQFLNKLAYGKIHGYSEQDEQEQVRQKMRLLRELLSRDERELQTFQDNLSMLNTDRSKVSKMMDSKLRAQERKVKIKQMLLNELKEQAG